VVICKHEGFIVTVISVTIIMFLFLSFICRSYKRTQNYAAINLVPVFLKNKLFLSCYLFMGEFVITDYFSVEPIPIYVSSFSDNFIYFLTIVNTTLSLLFSLLSVYFQRKCY